MDYRLIFLTYIQRSGSTYLDRLLNEYEGVFCTLANNFPDGLLLPAMTITNKADTKGAVDSLYASPKFNYDFLYPIRLHRGASLKNIWHDEWSYFLFQRGKSFSQFLWKNISYYGKIFPIFHSPNKK